MTFSELGLARQSFRPKLPKLLKNLTIVHFEEVGGTTCISDEEQIRGLFPRLFGQGNLRAVSGKPQKCPPRKVGVILSGGQASGGHNVIVGLFDALTEMNAKSELIGFLNGPSGLLEKKFENLVKKKVDNYRNSGGFDIIGAGRTKIETNEQLKAALDNAKELELDGLVIIGGDDSNTNAAVLAEYFKENNFECCVVGVPKTIDGDLRNEFVEMSFGFDTACKTYSEMIGNLLRDAISAKKYTHFVKLMGRSASHIALECALQTHPNLTYISEEVKKSKMTVEDITQEMADMIEKRSSDEKNFSVVLIPEGLIEFIPELEDLISTLNDFLSEETSSGFDELIEKVKKILSKEQLSIFTRLPKMIQEQLLLDRDPHGNVQVSHINTESLFIETVKVELKKRGFKGKFSPVTHFFGYEGRAGFPSNFDAEYCNSLGIVAALLINQSKSGYMACLSHLTKQTDSWDPRGVAITSLLNMEKRKGKDKPVIQKALVDLQGKPFKKFEKNRAAWKFGDDYRCPGPIQFEGKPEVVDSKPMTLVLERS